MLDHTMKPLYAGDCRVKREARHTTLNDWRADSRTLNGIEIRVLLLFKIVRYDSAHICKIIKRKEYTFFELKVKGRFCILHNAWTWNWNICELKVKICAPGTLISMIFIFIFILVIKINALTCKRILLKIEMNHSQFDYSNNSSLYELSSDNDLSL